MTAARAAYCHLAPLTPYVLPELKANQPHQSTNRPMQALTGLPSGNGLMPSAYRPMRGPSIHADANDADPPVNIGQSVKLNYNKTARFLMQYNRMASPIK